jgi:hypothetical protein
MLGLGYVLGRCHSEANEICDRCYVCSDRENRPSWNLGGDCARFSAVQAEVSTTRLAQHNSLSVSQSVRQTSKAVQKGVGAEATAQRVSTTRGRHERKSWANGQEAEVAVGGMRRLGVEVMRGRRNERTSA